jgi:tRNA/tmRNA/rRNA uracil-C5-methylase (TrmA/RlmC/RlmD family)
MSADPVTMFMVTAAKTVYDIKESKKQAEIEAQRYEAQKKAAQEIANQEAEERRETYLATIASNKATQAGSGFSLDSRSFLNIQKDVTTTFEKDLATIRLNVGTKVGDIGYAQDIAASQRRKEQFGGWASIASAGYEYKAKKDLYES